ncbi:hypothetical protein ACLB2K_044789 [Fragaria x ananassa]
MFLSRFPAVRLLTLASQVLICHLSLLAFRGKPLLVAVHAADPAPVRDIKGDNLQTGVEYWILPVILGKGGGLTLASNRNKTIGCPLDVVQEQSEISNGLPLTFSPVNLTKGVVRLSTDLNIKFSTSAAVTLCPQTSKVWKLDEVDESTGQRSVTTGGVEGNPSPKTLMNWFKIEKYDDDYKLVFCPKVCRFCRVICGDVGVHLESGVRRLALSDVIVPLKVMFKRV